MLASALVAVFMVLTALAGSSYYLKAIETAKKEKTAALKVYETIVSAKSYSLNRGTVCSVVAEGNKVATLCVDGYSDQVVVPYKFNKKTVLHFKNGISDGVKTIKVGNSCVRVNLTKVEVVGCK